MNCPSCQQDLPSTARFCSSCGTRCASTAADPAPAPPPGDERKPVTVLFCDLVGSTALSGVLDPETLRTVTLRYFEAMSAEITARGGTPEKFIGDAVMAVFGVPVVREDDARRALAAALGMRRALARLNEELAATLGIELATRVGVNTGQVVAGSDATARQALVSGETVNIAARLEQNAGRGEILIGPGTLLAAGPTVRAEPTGPLRLKGKRESVEAYRLLALGGDDPELLRRFDVPFVGRRAEQQALDTALDRAVRGGGGLLRVTGEAGIGKTRLVREWLTRRYASGGLSYGAGRCRSYGDHSTLAPLADAVRSLLASGPPGPSGGGTPGGEAGGPAVDDAMALLSGGLLRDGTPNASFEDMCAALTAVLDQAARRRPVVLVLDDWHAAAPLLVRTVRRLTDGTGCAGVLVLCAGRPEGPEGGDGPGGGGGHPCGAGQFQLTGLPREEAVLLAAGLAGQGGRPGPVDDRLLARAGGNPLYLEQLLIGDRAVPEGACRPGEELPPTLQALLGARIGALARPERSVVDLAAVIGREFTAPELVRLELAVRAGEGHGPGPLDGAAGPGPGHRLRVEEALAGLARRRLVESGPPGGGREAAAYRFSSGLVHEVAYASLSKRAKAERHAWAAELPSVLRSGDGAVGGHLERAYRYRAELGLLDDTARRLRERAAAALGRAGAQAAARSDLHWAHGLLERAVDLGPGDAAATRRLGEVRVALGRAREGAELLLRVRDMGADPVEAAHARLALAVLDPGGRGPGPAATARAVLPVFEAAGDATGLARAHLRLAQQFQRSGRHEEAERDQARALEQAVVAGAEPERAGALGAIGVSLWRGPVPAPAAVVRCRTLLAAHGAGRPTVRVTLNCPLAVLYALRDRPEEASGALAEAERLAGRLGFAEAEVFLPVFRATVAALLGRSEEALALLDRADEAARRTGAAGMRTAVALDAARLELDRGRADRAARWVADVADPAELSRADAVDLAGLRARLTAAERPGEALGQADRAVRASLLTDSPLVRATAELDRAHTLAALGRETEARACARSAEAHFTGKGHLPGARRAAGFLARPPSAVATTRERS
ncbi:adenylate/guanylate cyclase domain-containing protein [Streptomyces sp. WZ.A104]|uniref:adenylate/guanylate cyclase domain-containing protein n=1 Tax=Streptomyces sp. WZ.A104 TaxID=2023771 RepID=UPI000BBBEE26|nr:adenylate/guanylate cyclase domain-containing protein [Streptomyces sp. WZ.A104]PCG86543.1 adenylate/guanylate cyclase domain-containing protein [Streptomyces sp. WZ.A104]